MRIFQTSVARMVFLLSTLLGCSNLCGAEGQSVMEFAASSPTGVASAPKVHYWHNYNNNGSSDWALCTFGRMKKHIFIPGFPPFYTEETNSVNTSIVSQTVLWVPSSYDGSWHQDPFVQLNVFTSGEGVWTTQLGGNRTFKAGDFYLGDDHGTKGHLSKTIGDAPMVMLATQFHRNVSDVNNPCWL